jgi:hypothetical protein
VIEGFVHTVDSTAPDFPAVERRHEEAV